MRTPSWAIVCMVVTILVGTSTEALFAQRGRGGGRRGGASGLRDLRPSRRSQFDGYAWGAQKLLEANRRIMRRLPGPVRVYILEALKDWDNFFPAQQQQFETFFEKAQASERRELMAAFRDAIPEQLRTRNQPQQGRR